MADFVVTVAAVGPVFGWPEFPVFSGPSFEDQGWEVSYADRLTTQIPTNAETRLAEVMNAAAAAFGVGSLSPAGDVASQMHYAGFFQAGEESGLPPDWVKDWYSTLRIVGENRTPSWACAWQAVTFGELLASSEVGLVEGDPYRPYFWPVIPQGDSQVLSDALWTVWVHWEHILSAYGTYEIVKKMRARIKAGRATFDGDRTGLHDALARPQDVMPFLLSEARTTRQVAAKVGMTEEMTTGLLLGMGFVCAPDGRWQWQEEDEAAAALAESVRMIEEHGSAPPESVMRSLLPDEPK